MEFQSPPKSVWSTFKNAYLRRRNLRNFWKKLDKKNLSQELVNTMNSFLLSESYNWTSKFWRHLIIKHLKFLSDKSASNNYQNTISQEYSGFTYINEALIKESCEKIKENKSHFFSIKNKSIFSHIRLNIFPDGGISRIRIFGRTQ